ncbi:hypothetical protein YC2023_015078 [Brassica napus]
MYIFSTIIIRTGYYPTIQTPMIVIFDLTPIQEKEKKYTANMGFDYAPTYRFPASRIIPLDPVRQRSTSSGKVLPGLDRTQYRFGVQKRQSSFRMEGNRTRMVVATTDPNLSSAGLTGTIAAAVQNLTKLEKTVSMCLIDLSNNKLTGVVPEFLVQMKSLVIIYLSGNDLFGYIPQALRRWGLELLKGRRQWKVICMRLLTKSNNYKIQCSLIPYPFFSIALQLPPSTPMVNDAYGNSSEPSIETKKEGLLIQRL